MSDVALLSPPDFKMYTQRWQQLASGSDSDALRACLLSSQGKVMNYVYLPNETTVALLSAVGTVAIQLKFVVVPDATRPAPAETFTLALYGIDRNDNPTSAYYLASVPPMPATVQQSTSNEAVPFDLASTWLLNWAQLQPDDLTASLFDSRTEQGPLLGYTYPLPDFLAVLTQLKLPLSPALWFDFALHSYDNPGATVAGESRLFGTVVTLGSVPPPDQPGVIRLASELYYYDLAQPSPPRP